MTSDPVSIESQKSDPEASEHEERLLAFPGSTSAGRPHLRWILPLVALAVGCYLLLVRKLNAPGPKLWCPASPYRWSS